MRNRLFFTTGFLLLWLSTCIGQIATYNFEDSPDATGVDANITTSSVAVSSGSLLYQSGSDDGGSRIGYSSSWENGDFTTSGKYLEFEITPNMGYKVSYSEIILRLGRTDTGPQQVTVQISNDGFATAGNTVLSNGSISSTSTSSLNEFSITSSLPSDSEAPLTVRVYGHNASNTGNLRFNGFRIYGLVALPVHLNNFTGEVVSSTTHLTFTTTSELNNSHFNIERSTDGRSYQTIGRVEGKGTTEAQIDYEFIDEKPLSGWNYYRLKQVDYDGASEYFGPVSVFFGTEEEKEVVKIYPTAVADQFTLEVSTVADAPLHCTIINTNAQVLRQWEVQEKALRTSVSVSELPAGTYWLRWQQGSEQGVTRFVKL